MKKTPQTPRLLLGISLLALAASSFYWTGCGTDTQNTVSGPQPIDRIPVELSIENPRLAAIMPVQERHTREIMQANSTVVGTAVGVNEAGEPVIKVYLSDTSLMKDIPLEYDGVPVETEVTGIIHAMAGNTAKQTPPISLGTSGGWRYDLANGYCCGGTLGSLVKIGTTQYVLSNYHVFRSDIVSGGNGRVATNGDPIIQPALIDVSCNAATSNNVASLAGSASLPNSNTDCAIASVISGMVKTDGSILGIGTISASTVAASVNKKVKKSGRTTGLTRSTITGLNATISVAYDNECAGGAAFTKTYTGQIVIKNTGSRFLNSGDSGSLMVEDVTTNPRAVGLLFAGSSSTAVANPIGQVLSFLGATMVGN